MMHDRDERTLYARQQDRIAELEADLKLSKLVANEQRERAYKFESKFFVPPHPIGTHCGWCGRGLPGGTPPLSDRIAALEAELAAVKGAHDIRCRELADACGNVLAERERREAAEALLDAANLFLNDSKSTLARNVETNIKAHFAHYKD